MSESQGVVERSSTLFVFKDKMMKRFILSLLMVASLAGPVYAQSPVSKSNSGTVGAENTWVTLDNVSGYGSVGADIRGTFSATLEVQCSVNGTNYLAVRMTPPNSTTAATTMTDVGEWANGAIAGCWKVRIGIPTGNYTSGSANVVIRAVATGGGGGSGAGGGGGGGDFDIASFQAVFGSTSTTRTATLADNIALTVDSHYVASVTLLHDGATLDLAPGNSTDGMLVNLGANNDVTITGSVTVAQATAANLNATVVGTGTFAVQAAQSGTWNIGSLTTFPDNEPFNVAQINGVTVLMGNGATGTGSQRVTLANDSTLPTGWASAANQSTEITSLQLIDNIAPAVGSVGAGTAATASLFAGGQYNSTPLTLTNTQGAALQLDANGYLKVNTAAGAAAGGTSSNFGSAFPTPGTAAGFTDGTTMVAGRMITTQADDQALSLDGIVVSAFMYCHDGTNMDLCRVASGGAGVIDANTGRVTIATDDDLSDMATLIEAMMVAHDAADAGNPIKIGGRAVAFGSTPTAVSAAGDRIDFLGTRAGIPFVQPGHPNMQSVECQVEDADGAQTGTACVSVSTGTKIIVTGVAVHCDGDTDAPTNVITALDTDTTLPSRAHNAGASYLAAFDGVPAGGGMSKGFNGGVLAQGADDEDLRFTMEDPVGGACSVEFSYYTIAT